MNEQISRKIIKKFYLLWRYMKYYSLKNIQKLISNKYEGKVR